MDRNRKKIILQEIQFWKEHNMLPSHYCDYLTALYTEGEEQEIESAAAAAAKKQFPAEAFIYPLMAVILLGTLLITYFTELSFSMQTGIMSFFVILILLFSGYFIKKRKNPLLLFISLAFLLLLYSVEINDVFFSGGTVSLYILMAANIGAWLLIGILKRQPFFLFAGGLSVLFLIARAFFF